MLVVDMNTLDYYHEIPCNVTTYNTYLLGWGFMLLDTMYGNNNTFISQKDLVNSLFTSLIILPVMSR